MPELSLIICTRNREDMIGDVLESAANQTLGKSQYEIVVIDQSSNDETQKLVEKYPDFKYIKLDSRGVSISRNEGIKQSSGEILVYIDDDILFENDYLENILTFYKTSELKPDMVGGKTIVKFLGQKPEWLEGPLLGILAHSDYGDESLILDSHPKHVPYTCNMAIKRECLEKIGGFSEFLSELEQKFPINEDVMFAHEIKNQGYNLVYDPKMFVYHRMPASRMTYKYYSEKYFAHGKSDAYLYYLLKMFDKKEAPGKILLHSKRILEGLILQHFKTEISEKYYQKLRFHYNLGYIGSLFRILMRRNNKNYD
ncbi:MAG: hypothetical protein ACD_20C00097G0003 [uncultured bacterium]|nr:MAG: hypothetical protein ACD_20C00097G0003 [uncultured bacterium]HBH17875.1 hypothetical protein [Cyanobacteria bacterium UBA9579]